MQKLPQIEFGNEFAIDFANSSLVEYFAWCEEECNFGYVQCNTNENNVSKEKCFNLYKDCGCCSEYKFKLEPYILLKLSVRSYAEDTVANNFVKSQPAEKKKINAEIPKKYTNNLFAKVTLGNLPKMETSILKFYETPLERFDEIRVSFINRNGCEVDLKCDNTITLEIMEAVDVLKDTLIESKHGEANITGIRN